MVQQKILKTKLKTKKDDVEKMQNQFQETQNSHAQVVNHMRRAQQTLATDLNEKSKKLEDLTRVMKETHGNQIQELLTHNQKILIQQHEFIQNVPSVLKVNSELLQDTKKLQVSEMLRSSLYEDEKYIRATTTKLTLFLNFWLARRRKKSHRMSVKSTTRSWLGLSLGEQVRERS